MADFNEPWDVPIRTPKELRVRIKNKDGRDVHWSPNTSMGVKQKLQNARRIAACVNALKGIPTEHLEQFGLAGVMIYVAENQQLK